MTMLERLRIDIWLLGVLFLLAATHAFAAVPTLSNLNESQVQTVARDFTANFVHTSVSQASGLRGFGLEIGALAGLTQSPGINDLVQENYGYIPHAGAIGILYMPGGVRAEYLLLPKYIYQGATLENNSVALGWTPSEIYSPNGFLSIRVRGYYGDGQIGYSQIVQDIPINVNFRSFTYGGDVALSFQNIPFIEPYFSSGIVRLDGQLGAGGSVSIFDQTFTAQKQIRVEQQGNVYSAGFVIKMPMFVAGAEYSRIMEDTRITVKLALQFPPANAKNLK